jgi:hypothetical protein
MTAEKYLEIWLGGNMNVGTLTPHAITEFAKDFAQQNLREELLKFNSWMCGEQYDGKIPLIETCIDEYLKQR